MKNIYIYGTIGTWDDEISAAMIQSQVDLIRAGEDCTVYINSPGGDVFEGLTIYNIFLAMKPRPVIKVLGQASSIASIISCAGAKVEIAESGLMYIHNPIAFRWGGINQEYLKRLDKELESLKASMISIYAKKTGKSASVISAWMNDERYRDAKECIEYNLVDGYINQTDEDVKALYRFIAYANNAKNPPPRDVPDKGNQKINNSFNNQGATTMTMTLEEAISKAATAEARATQFESENKTIAGKLTAQETQYAELKAQHDKAHADLSAIRAENEAYAKRIKEADDKAAAAEQAVFKNEIETLCAKLVSETKIFPKERDAEAALLLDMRNSSPEKYQARIQMLQERPGIPSLTNPLFEASYNPTSSADDAVVAALDSAIDKKNERSK